MRTLALFLSLVVIGESYLLWHQAGQVTHAEQIYNIQLQKIKVCNPSVFSPTNNYKDALRFLRRNGEQFGNACVFLPNGTYGYFSWRLVQKSPTDAHVEDSWEPAGRYDTPDPPTKLRKHEELEKD